MLSDTENLTIIIPLVIVSDRQRKSIVRCSETTVLCCLVKLFIINTAPDNLPDSLLCLCDHRHGWIKYRANIKYSFNEREQQQGWQCHKLINFHLWYEDVRKFVRNFLSFAYAISPDVIRWRAKPHTRTGVSVSKFIRSHTAAQHVLMRRLHWWMKCEIYTK